MQFTELVSPELSALLEARGILEASPIQAQSLPHTLAGRDLVGRARTGTGKTLAFALPILSKLTPSRERGRLPRAIIMAPTRELAKQVSEEFSKSGPAFEILTIYGGAAYGPQEKALQRGVAGVFGGWGRSVVESVHGWKIYLVTKLSQGHSQGFFRAVPVPGAGRPPCAAIHSRGTPAGVTGREGPGVRRWR